MSLSKRWTRWTKFFFHHHVHFRLICTLKCGSTICNLTTLHWLGFFSRFVLNKLLKKCSAVQHIEKETHFKMWEIELLIRNGSVFGNAKRWRKIPEQQKKISNKWKYTSILVRNYKYVVIMYRKGTHIKARKKSNSIDMAVWSQSIIENKLSRCTHIIYNNNRLSFVERTPVLYLFIWT